MDWTPLGREQLRSIIENELADCSEELRTYFATVAFEPAKWHQSTHGDEGGGFWAIAADGGRVLWFNDIEDGFNVSAFTEWGTIPTSEYWCNQDDLKHALPVLRDGPIRHLGPPAAVEPTG